MIKKKLVAVILSMIMILSFIPNVAFAIDDEERSAETTSVNTEIASINFTEPIKLKEHEDGSWVYTKTGDKWFSYRCRLDSKVRSFTITYGDGTVVPYKYVLISDDESAYVPADDYKEKYDIMPANGSDSIFEPEDPLVYVSQSYNSPWEAGNTYKIKGSYQNCAYEIPVTIIPSETESMEVEIISPVKLIKDTDGIRQPTYYAYSKATYKVVKKFKLTYKNGDVVNYLCSEENWNYVPDDSKYPTIYCNEVNITWDRQEAGRQLQTGEQYTATVYVKGASADFPFIIVDTDIDDFDLEITEPIALDQKNDSYLTYGNGSYAYGFQFPVYDRIKSFKITYINGDVVRYTRASTSAGETKYIPDNSQYDSISPDEIRVNCKPLERNDSNWDEWSTDKVYDLDLTIHNYKTKVPTVIMPENNSIIEAKVSFSKPLVLIEGKDGYVKQEYDGNSYVDYFVYDIDKSNEEGISPLQEWVDQVDVRYKNGDSVSFKRTPGSRYAYTSNNTNYSSRNSAMILPLSAVQSVKKPWKAGNTYTAYAFHGNFRIPVEVSVVHDFEQITEGKEATCTELGYTGERKCRNDFCNYYGENEVIPAKGHQIKDGKCQICGAQIEVNVDNKSEVVVSSTVSEDIDDSAKVDAQIVAENTSVNATSVIDSAEVPSVEEIASTMNITAAPEDVVISASREVQMDVEIQKYDVANRTVTMDITPFIVTKITADIKDAESIVKEDRTQVTELAEGKSVDVTVALPDEFGLAGEMAYINLLHDGKANIYKVPIEEKDGKLFVKFTNTVGFSTVEVTKNAPEAEFNWKSDSKCEVTINGQLINTTVTYNTVDVKTPATCLKAGVKSIVAVATINGVEYVSPERDIPIPAKGHNYKHIIQKAGYCKNGSDYYKCSSCGKIINKKILAGYSNYYVKNYKLTNGKRYFIAKWSKQSSAHQKKFSGYQVQYSLKSSMTSAKTVTAKKYSTYKKVSKLKAKTTYYVRVRTYRTVSGKTYYSKWSTKKSIRTR